MGEFDVEIRNSIRELQASVRSMTNDVDKGNESLRQAQGHAKGLAQAHDEAAHAAHGHAGALEVIHENHRKIGQAAQIAGGHAGHLGAELAAMATFNPLALGIGAAFGFITAQVEKLIEKLGEAKEKIHEAAEAPEQVRAGIKKATDAAMSKADVQGIRRTLFDAEAGDDAMTGIPAEQQAQARRAARMAVQSGHARTEEDALKLIGKSGIFGGGSSAFSGARRAPTDAQVATVGAGVDMDPDTFAQNLARSTGSGAGQAASAAESRQIQERLIRDGREAELLAAGAGQAGSVDVRTSRANNDALNATLTKLEGTIDRLERQVREQGNGPRSLFLERLGVAASAEDQLQSARAEYNSLQVQLQAASR